MRLPFKKNNKIRELMDHEVKDAFNAPMNEVFWTKATYEAKLEYYKLITLLALPISLIIPVITITYSLSMPNRISINIISIMLAISVFLTVVYLNQVRIIIQLSTLRIKQLDLIIENRAALESKASTQREQQERTRKDRLKTKYLSKR